MTAQELLKQQTHVTYLDCIADTAYSVLLTPLYVTQENTPKWEEREYGADEVRHIFALLDLAIEERNYYKGVIDMIYSIVSNYGAYNKSGLRRTHYE